MHHGDLRWDVRTKRFAWIVILFHLLRLAYLCLECIRLFICLYVWNCASNYIQWYLCIYLATTHHRTFYHFLCFKRALHEPCCPSMMIYCISHYFLFRYIYMDFHLRQRRLIHSKCGLIFSILHSSVSLSNKNFWSTFCSSIYVPRPSLLKFYDGNKLVLTEYGERQL